LRNVERRGAVTVNSQKQNGDFALSNGRAWSTSSLSLFRTRLLLLMALVVLPALGLVLYGNLEQRRLENEGVRREAMAIAHLAAASQQNFVKNTKQLLGTLTQFPVLLLATNREFSDGNFFNLRTLSPDYQNFGLIESDGRLFSSAQRTNAGMYLGDRSDFQRVMHTRGFAVGDFQLDRLTSGPALNFGYPVLDDRGEIKRVLFAGIKLPRLSDAIANIGLFTGASVTIVDRTGTVVARQPDPDKWVGKSLAQSPVIQRMLARHESAFEMPGLEGVPALHAATVVTDDLSPALLVDVEMPLSTSFAHANMALLRNFILVAIVGVLVWVAAGFYARRFFLQPVRILAAAAQQLAEGDLGARVKSVGGAAELMELGRVFDEMAARLQRRQAEIQQANEQIRTLNHELECRVADRTAQLESANKELEAFSYSVSHDLRAPLRHILGFTDCLKRDAAPALQEHGQYLDFIEASARQMGHLIEDLLSFSRTARVEPKRTRFNLTVLAEEIRDQLAAEIKDRKVEWKIAPLPEVHADPAMLRIALTNLFSNALKYSRTRDVARIEIRSESKDNEHVVSVKDNGVGFDMRYAQKLFGVFQRLHDAREFEGTGVGLAIVQRIIARHGGRVWAEAELDQGATFYFSLPRQ
jgi:signal transduction histidine kinase